MKELVDCHDLRDDYHQVGGLTQIEDHGVSVVLVVKMLLARKRSVSFVKLLWSNFPDVCTLFLHVLRVIRLVS